MRKISMKNQGPFEEIKSRCKRSRRCKKWLAKLREIMREKLREKIRGIMMAKNDGQKWWVKMMGKNNGQVWLAKMIGKELRDKNLADK